MIHSQCEARSLAQRSRAQVMMVCAWRDLSSRPLAQTSQSVSDRLRIGGFYTKTQLARSLYLFFRGLRHSNSRAPYQPEDDLFQNRQHQTVESLHHDRQRAHGPNGLTYETQRSCRSLRVTLLHKWRQFCRGGSILDRALSVLAQRVKKDLTANPCMKSSNHPSYRYGPPYGTFPPASLTSFDFSSSTSPVEIFL